MKRLLLLGLLALSLASRGQTPPDTLALSFRKTTHLIFPTSILSVDRGSGQVLAESSQALDNVLLVKAARKAFEPTNLTVITSDGKLYSFELRYQEQPQPLVWRHREGSVTFSETAQRALQARPFLRRPHVRRGGAKLRVRGLYRHEQRLYVLLALTNAARLPWVTGTVEARLQDRRLPKRTARQHVPIAGLQFVPVKVAPGQQQPLVVALPAQSWNPRKVLRLELAEKTGGGRLTLTLSPRHLQTARPL
ncbi:DUF4138 domain-containing protein [Siphonobacter curvatus]|uniref:Conjugative transposon protein TraN n=1 Tax=Siphonobacter curvatus TaxID=2094562 RepID=A0A2S7IET3_9BACT|nr:DUF4138 domain-containing protein [Siphonobacter curvatus]PQA53190.1 hypothetical protein C5O19_25000 [Siphonobacter curvatus]